MKILMGNKYYKFIDDKPVVFRLIKQMDKTCVITDGKNKLRLPYAILDKEFTKLESHGVLFFNILKVGNKQSDVAVTLFRKEDLSKIDNKPYCICRQKINNIFKHQYDNVVLKRDDRIHLGMSISQDTCSGDIPFESLLACDGIESTQQISVYIDDNLDTILQLLGSTTQYDQELKSYYNEITKDPKFVGLTKTLKELLVTNEFMYDFERAFKVHRVDFDLQYNEENYQLDYTQRNILEQELNVEMFKTYVTKFDYTIAISKIERNYIIVIDKNNDIYIVAYDKGDYINTDMKSIIRQKENKGWNK